MRIKLYSIPKYTGTKVIDGAVYYVTVRWNTYTEKWYMDLVGQSNDVAIRGIALLCGRDLLAPFGYRNIFGQLYLVDNSGRNEDPGFDEMGTRWTLEYTALS